MHADVPYTEFHSGIALVIHIAPLEPICLSSEDR